MRRDQSWCVVTSAKERRAGEFFIKHNDTFVLKVYADSMPDTHHFAHWLARQLRNAERAKRAKETT